MAKHKKLSANCDRCANTGILSASLVDQGVAGRYIVVKVCEGHFSNDAAEKNILAMNEQTGLAVTLE